MNKSSILLVAFVVLSMVALGCTATTTQKGAAIGAVGGALIGQAAGRDTKSTIIGAAAGGLTGALVGDMIQQEQLARAEAEREAAEAHRELDALRSEERQPAKTAVTYPQGQYQHDPTIGEFTNNTRWEIKVFVDAPTNDLQRVPHLALGPYETAPANLDIGEHRLSATAYVKTQYGERLVGRYESRLYVDPRDRGWRVNFEVNSFN